MQQPPNQNDGAGSEIRSDAKQLGATAADRLHSEVDARKATAVTQAQSVSSAVRQAADGLDEGSPEWLKSAFRQGAQQIQRLADSVERKDSRQLMSDAQDFARNNPGTFLAACAAVGFAAARVLKAGGAQYDGQQDGQQQSGGTQSFGGSPAYQGQAQGQAGSPPHGTDLAYGSGTEAGIRADAPGEFA
jgi:ElaB/YqjD/DUF883 family membrane-anchored ribosome-binding protein